MLPQRLQLYRFKKCIFVNCALTGMRSIPLCMPYKKVSMDLSYNHINNFRYSASGLKNVESLNLSHNEIERLSTAAVLNMTNIAELDLSYNKLTKLPTSILELQGARINIVGNVFDCSNCEQVGVLQHVVREMVQPRIEL